MPGGLPLEPLSSLIGREREITGLVELLHARRLVTLTGPGGVGKSRLALAVAHAAPGPAWFAGLAELSDPKVTIETGGLSPEATELANRLARDIGRLSPEDLTALRAELIKRVR